MNWKQRITGISIAISGLLLFCCICPLATNTWLGTLTGAASPTNRFNLYSQLFIIFGSPTWFEYVPGIQFLCVSVLALVVLVLGVVASGQARKGG
jgi:hypothetical protein